jgi:phenylacetate-CoA ligase
MPSRAEIESRQLGLLRSLFARLPAESFYGRKFAGLAAPSSLADFSRNFPFTLKSEIAADQRAFPPFGTILTEPLANYTRFHQTSGTTSSPIRWLDTPESWQAIGECWMEVFRNAGVTREDRIFFAFSFGPFLGFWMAFDAAQRLGCLCLPAGGMTSAARLRMLLDARATVLCCTTTYAARLAEAAAQEGIDLSGSKIRRIMVAGEAGGSIPSVRAHLERLWPGASVYDHHGMTEVGPVTYECPATPCRLHVMEGAFIAEVVDSKTGQAVADAGTGELVLTNLVRTASPLLRYRTGDVVRAIRHEPCACGSSNLALEGGILGRVDDMVVVRGVNIFPSAIDEIVRGFPEVTEYRAVVRTTNALTEMELEIEAASDLRTALERALQAAFSLRIPVRIVPENSLPRSEMKSRRLVRVGKSRL